MAETTDKNGVVLKVGDRVVILPYEETANASGPEMWPDFQPGSEHVVQEIVPGDNYPIGLGGKDGTPFFATYEVEKI